MTNQVVEVLMNRDGMAEHEAIHHIENVREMMNDAFSSGNYSDVEDIMYSELGLELDYIFDVMGF